MFKRVSIVALLVVFTTFLGMFQANAQDGQALFKANCASCHNPLKDVSDRALNGMDQRAPSKEWLYKWVRSSSALVASGDKYAVELFNKWNKVPMTSFPNLTDADIDAIIEYVNSVEPVSPAGGASAGVQGKEADNT